MSAPIEPLTQVVVADAEKLQTASSSSRSAASADGEEAKAPDPTLQPPTEPKKKWYRRLNPLRWQKLPPVPEERTPSPEYGASFFSTVSFQWMSPLMQVRDSENWLEKSPY